MNSYLINGAKSEKFEALASDVICWCFNKLLPYHSTIHVDVHFKGIRKGGADGYCEWIDSNVAPREFKITVERSLGKENIIKTIIHEMVHVKQYAKGELAERYKDGHKQLWKAVDHSNTKYDDQPWEIEAHTLQDSLYEEYINEAG